MWTTENRHRYDRDKLRYPSDLTDAEWQLIKPLIPAAKRGGGKRTVVMREVVNGLMYVLSTGCQWRTIPKDLPPRSTVNGYFCQWSWDGTLERIHDALSVKCREQGGREISPTACVIDSQSVKSAEKRLSWLSSIVPVFDNLTRRAPAQGWRAAPAPSAAATLIHPASYQLGF
jgi:transposase